MILGIGAGIGFKQVSQRSSVIISDKFDRANNNTSLGIADTGQTWQILGTGVAGINNNQAYWSNSPGSYSFAVVDSLKTNIDASVVINNMASNCGFAFRMQDENNGLFVRNVAGVSLYLSKRKATSVTNLGTYSFAGTSVTLRVVAVGTSVKVYANDTLIFDVIEADFQTATKHGFMSLSNTTSTYNNLEIKAT